MSEELEPRWADVADTEHCCESTTYAGYGQAVDKCWSDANDRMWMSDKTGRKVTQCYFCPFCGMAANNDTAPESELAIVPVDLALTPKDKTTAVWVHYSAGNRPVMSHDLFGTLFILASDGCHAKALTQHNAQVTVCVENLQPLKGERVLPKVEAKEKATKPKKDRNTIDPELMKKYLNMGLD